MTIGQICRVTQDLKDLEAHGPDTYRLPRLAQEELFSAGLGHCPKPRALLAAGPSFEEAYLSLGSDSSIEMNNTWLTLEGEQKKLSS